MTKREENLCIQILRKELPDFPKGELLPSERPDFVIQTAAGLLGVEVTKLYITPDSANRSLRALEGEGDLTLEAAMRAYVDNSSPPVEVWVRFARQNAISKKDRLGVADQLSSFVASHTPVEGSWATHHKIPRPAARFPDLVDSITIARFNQDRNYWHVSGAGWVQEDCVEEIQATITKKDGAFVLTDNRCTYLWLLIVIEGDRPSSFFNPSPITLRHHYTGRCQRVFLLHLTNGSLHELSVSGAT